MIWCRSWQLASCPISGRDRGRGYTTARGIGLWGRVRGRGRSSGNPGTLSLWTSLIHCNAVGFSGFRLMRLFHNDAIVYSTTLRCPWQFCSYDNDHMFPVVRTQAGLRTTFGCARNQQLSLLHWRSTSLIDIIIINNSITIISATLTS